VALVVAWVHGCLGLYFWLRFRPWFPRAASVLLVVSVLAPVLALLGFAHGGQEVATIEPAPWPEGVDSALVAEALRIKQILTDSIYAAFVAVLAAVLGARSLRIRRERSNLIEVRYADGQAVRVPRGFSVLEASRIGGIPHYSVCGGRGRCSTCRIRVVDGSPGLPSVGEVEQATLSRISAEPDVRLACQLRPDHDLKVMPLLAADRGRSVDTAGRQATPGREQEIAILFCDIRGFTALADRRLPFDIVFLLNRYFAIVGKAVEEAGGRLDKFIGDGAMAIFGFDAPKSEACRQALVAAAAIIEDVARLSEELAGEISAPLRVAIGIHAGPAIVGAMGYGRVMGVTAIGDTVNTASRLESVAKEFDAAIVVSASAVRVSGLDLSAFEIRQIEVRGRARPLRVHVVPQGQTLTITPLPVA
jgi:adenylate cyclase